MKQTYCPGCGGTGQDLPELSELLMACMNTNCRVNEYEIET